MRAVYLRLKFLFKYGKKAEADLIVAKGKEEAPVNVVEKQSESDLWKPVINELQVLGEEHSQEDKSWLYVFVTGFLGGLLALFTPLRMADYSYDCEFFS